MRAKALPFLILTLFFFAHGFVKAQNASVSPYSRYGLGEIPFGAFAKNNGMGGLGIGLRPVFNINPVNPASYSSMMLTTFEIGAEASLTRFSTATLTQDKSDATLSYFALGFPVIKGRWGAALGLMPFSNVGYTITESLTDINAGSILNTYEGSGGINRFFIGNSVKLFDNFSAGFNASYLFGSLKRTASVEFSGANFFNSRFTESTDIKDFYFNYGLQYVIDSLPKKTVKDSTTVKIKTDRSLSFGLTFSSATDLSAEKNFLGERYELNPPIIFIKDTTEYRQGEKGTITIPLSAGFGFMYRNGSRWLIGAEVSVQNWQDFSYYGQSDSLRSSMKIAAGMQYTPDERAMKSYWQSVQYRFGVFYNETYLQLKNSKLNEAGVTIGLGFPVRKGLSMIQISACIGTRGTTDNNLIREDFARFSLGFTFNDRWFVKPKFD
jgi:hypothetical protein